MFRKCLHLEDSFVVYFTPKVVMYDIDSPNQSVQDQNKTE